MTTTRRNALLPEIPTVAEAALSGYEIMSWEGAFAPAGTPRDIVTKLDAAIGAVLNAREVKDLWTSKGVEIVTSTPADFTVRLREDYVKTGELLKKAGLKVQ